MSGPSNQEIRAEIADFQRQIDEAIRRIQRHNSREDLQFSLSPIAHETSNSVISGPESAHHLANCEEGSRRHFGQQTRFQPVLDHLARNGSVHVSNVHYPTSFPPHENDTTNTTTCYINNSNISQHTYSANQPNSSNAANNPACATANAAVHLQRAPLPPQTAVNQPSSSSDPSFDSHTRSQPRPPPGSPALSMHNTAPPSDGNFNLELVLRKIASDVENLSGEVVDLNGEVVSLREQVLDQQSASASNKRPSMKGNKTERPRSRQRTSMTTYVRVHMNKLLGIKVDSQITEVVLDTMVDDNTIRNFNAGLIQSPPLEPLRLKFDKPKCDWNVALSRKFADQLPRPNPQCLWSSADIAKHFLDRIETLERVLRANLPISPDETPDQLASRLLARRQALLHEKRIRKRQTTLRTIRMKTALARANGGRELAWTALYDLADRIGIDGHSSDETDDEDSGYAVRTKPWRSREISRLLRFIDTAYNTKNEYGNNKGGARSHTRYRNKLVYSQHNYVKGLPHNIYDPGWLSTLTVLQREAVDIADIDMNLPVIQEPGSMGNSRLLFQEHRVST